MHIEYAAGVFKGRMQSAPIHALIGLVAEPEFLQQADLLGDKKVQALAAKLLKAYDSGLRFQKATQKQRETIAAALLEKHGTPLAVYAAAMGMSELQFMAIVEAV
ncbi:hypothetical protein [Azohydromonas lata]|uniref:hypothetical protein n=1 Tax=Azohydromonas lata TaxID=45677 RepID=UPI0008338BB2|nr:hypothetical protein [Azohydromonas lata]